MGDVIKTAQTLQQTLRLRETIRNGSDDASELRSSPEYRAAIHFGTMIDTITALEAENKRLRETLEWYADETMTYSLTQQSEPRSAVHADRGERARAALEGE